MSFNKIVYLFTFFCFIFFTNSLSAQVAGSQNLSSIRVDELNDDQIRSFISQVEASGLTQSQLEQYAASRGMSPTEVKKLRDRVEKLNGADNKTKNGAVTKVNTNKTRVYQPENTANSLPFADSIRIKSQEELALDALKSRIYGMDLFRDAKTAFEPNLRLATPANYVLGPDDEILIDIYGYSEVSHQLKVSPEGSINIPYAGIVQVANLTIEAATARIRSKLNPIYSSLSTGNTKLSVSLGNIRSIKVILTGELTKPGTYTLPSVATVFNALYSSGGPTENGSFRNIELIRAGKKIATLDIYDFLLNGDLINNFRLQDQDIIRVPTYQIRVEMVGEIKRPFFFEMEKGEPLSKLLSFAGGFTEKAYQARIKVFKNTATERKINDVVSENFNTYLPQSGDKYFVSEILDRFENRVSIEGAVFRPGQYELEPGLTLKSLILKAEGVKEDAFLSRGYLTRLTPDLNTTLISFDVNKILNGESVDIQLLREDIINISSIFDLKEEYKVQINGEVRAPGEFAFSENMSLEEVIIKAGGLRESASTQRIEISRRVKNANANSKSATITEIFQTDINQDLSITAAKFTLQPFDIIIVRSAPGYEIQKQVKIEGEVLYPGLYAITKKDERISDLIRRAGGLTVLAFTEGASLKRENKFDTQLEKEREQQKLLQFKKIQSETSDSSNVNLENISKRNNFVGIDLTQILIKPGEKKDLFLEDGDIINVPKELQTIKVSGEVLYPNTIVFKNKKSFKSYVLNAGGFGEKALKRRAYIIYANGGVKSTKKILFFNKFPAVDTGAEIFVPKKEEKRKLSTSESLGIVTGIASLGVIIIGILNTIK